MQSSMKGLELNSVTYNENIDSNIAKSFVEFLTTSKTKIINKDYILNQIRHMIKRKSGTTLSIGYGAAINYDVTTNTFEVELSTFSKDKGIRIDRITTSKYEAYRFIETEDRTLPDTINTEKEPLCHSRRIEVLQDYLS